MLQFSRKTATLGTVPNVLVFLLADAEVAEDVTKNIISGDIAGNGGEVVDALADVLTQEIA